MGCSSARRIMVKKAGIVFEGGLKRLILEVQWLHPISGTKKRYKILTNFDFCGLHLELGLDVVGLQMV